MKYIFAFLLSIIFSITGYAQDTIALKQEFSFLPFQIKSPEKLEERAGLTLVSTVRFKYKHDGVFIDPCVFELSLKDDKGKLVYLSDVNPSYKAREDYSERGKTRPEELKYFIYWEKIQLPPGNHSLTLSIQASQDGYVVGKSFTQKININIPKLISTDQQKIEYSKIFIKDNATYKGLRGIMIYADVWVKYATWRTRGIAYDKELISLFHKTNLITEQGTTLLPDETNLYASLYQEKSETENDSSTVKFIQFLPYHIIQTPPGNQTQIIELKTFAKGYIERPINKYSIAFSWFQPRLQVVTFSVDSISIAYGKYDYSSVIGRIFSRPGSNVGRGYPDTYWMAAHGEMSEYESGRYKNSFSAPPGSVHFTTVDNNELAIKLYDYDFVGPDDLLGSFALDNSPGNKYSLRKYKSDNTDNVQIEYKKEELYIPDSSLFGFSPIKLQGVSGYKFSISPNFTGTTNQVLKTSLLAMPHQHQIHMYDFTKENWEKTEKTEIDLISLKKYVEFFIPAIELNGRNQIILQNQYPYFQQNFKTTYTLEPANQTNDFTISAGKIVPVNKYGVNGFEIEMIATFHPFYNKFRNSLNWQVTFNSKQENTSFDKTYNLGTWSYFIPYTTVYKEFGTSTPVFKVLITDNAGVKYGETAASLPKPEGNFYELNKIEISIEKVLESNMKVCIGNYENFVCSHSSGNNISFAEKSIFMHEKDELIVWIEYGNEYTNSDNLFEYQLNQKKLEKRKKAYKLKKNDFTGKWKLKYDVQYF